MASTLQPERPASRVRQFPLNLSTTLGRQRIVGAALLVALLGLFFALVDAPRLDSARQSVADRQGSSLGRPVDEFYGNRAIQSEPITENCFQGFCFEGEQGVLRRWVDFSVAYLEVVAGVVLVALVAAALVDAFLFPTVAGPAFGKRSRPGSLRATLNGPALILTLVLFSPLLVVSRLGLGVVAALGVAAVLVPPSARDRTGESLAVLDPSGAPRPWGEVLVEGAKRALLAWWRFFYRLTPLFVAAAFIGGIAIQYLTLDGVQSVIGDHVLGVALAATAGVMIAVPMLWEIPAVAGLILVGLGIAPAATLLFTLATGGVLALRRGGDGSVSALRRVAVVWVIGVVGGVLVLGWQQVSEAGTAAPTISFDGTTCSYSGPDALEPGSHDFTIANEIPLTEETERFPMAVVVGRLDEGSTIEGFAADVAADPKAPFPPYFTEAGMEKFVFPGTTEVLPVVVHNPGRYASACMLGEGGFYVIAEFSMIQPQGWFEEFRDTFRATVASEVFRVEP